MGEKGEGSSRNMLKDPRTKPKGGRVKGGRCTWVGWERVVEWGMETIVLEQLKKIQGQITKN